MRYFIYYDDKAEGFFVGSGAPHGVDVTGWADSKHEAESFAAELNEGESPEIIDVFYDHSHDNDEETV